MITVITRWEHDILDPTAEWRMWRQIKGAFAVSQSANFRLIFIPRIPSMNDYSFDQYDTEEEAIASLAPNTQVCFLEPYGQRGMYDLPSLTANRSSALVLGNATHSNMNTLVEPADAYSIRTANKVDMFGINAAAIALAFMAGQ